jgi:hypothetical protein
MAVSSPSAMGYKARLAAIVEACDKLTATPAVRGGGSGVFEPPGLFALFADAMFQFPDAKCCEE